MSTISASTTTTTAFRITTDTAGTLVFQTGSTPTTAMTLGSDQSVTFAGAQTYTGAATFSAGITVQGLTVGRGAGAVSTNTAVGVSALAANTTGDTNTATGYQALNSNQGGASNTAYGVQAMRYNTSGGANAAHGRGSLYSNTSGSYNTGIGQDALSANTTANYNTAVGYQAGYNNTTGTQNVFQGSFAGFNNTTGSYNTSLGYNAYAVSGTAATGNYNTAVGNGALNQNTTASNNTAVGYQAGYSAVQDSNSTYLGYQAGYSANYGTVSAQANTFVGYRSGYSMTTGYYNTILGSYSGNSGGLDIRTSSNYIVLSDGQGNVEFTAKDGSSWALPGATVKTGTGITFPATQSASSDANTLDDYEEGTFTPTVLGFSTPGTGTYNGRAGRYTKIGNRCFIQVWVDWNNLSGASGALGFGGLPFTAINTTYAYNPFVTYMDGSVSLSANNVIQSYVPINDSRILLTQYVTGGGNAATVPLDSTGSIMITGSYEVA